MEHKETVETFRNHKRHRIMVNDKHIGFVRHPAHAKSRWTVIVGYTPTGKTFPTKKAAIEHLLSIQDVS